MATVTTTPEPALLTAEQFANRPDPGHPEELVDGRIVPMTPPRPFHGHVCANLCEFLKTYVRTNDLGYVLSNDSGVITRRNPDSVRGADIAFYSYNRVPKGTLPRTTYLDVVPDLVAEVLSPDDRWPHVLAKVAEYIQAGVAVVLVIDTDRQDIQIFATDAPVRTLDAEAELTLPAPLDGFRLPVARLFE